LGEAVKEEFFLSLGQAFAGILYRKMDEDNFSISPFG
jgi:hypothetical protein